MHTYMYIYCDSTGFLQSSIFSNHCLCNKVSGKHGAGSSFHSGHQLTSASYHLNILNIGFFNSYCESDDLFLLV